ncbi:methyl-accepting chemotaxis protein [Aeromonas sp. R6-2]|uniref:methyl-accepting chemotaxis protein n=1 Tax=Aeromonas sp. R6-2 TaxID=3138472 RepID=UPI0034A1A9BB
MKSLSVQWRITLSAGLCLLLLSVSLISFSLYQGREVQSRIEMRTAESARGAAQQVMQAQGLAQSARVTAYLDESFYRASLLAQGILFQRKNAQDNFMHSEALRGALNQMLHESLLAAPNLLGVYGVFEPDALDGEDANYVDSSALGSNEKGRFSVYWARGKEGIVAETMSEEDLADSAPDESGTPANYWYRCSLESRSSCLLEPYLDEVEGQSRLMTSVTVPLMEEGKVIGIVGVDLALDSLQQVVQGMDEDLYRGSGDVMLISQGGTVAAQSGFNTPVGKPLGGDPLGGQLKGWLKEGAPLSRWSEDGAWLQSFTPIRVAGHSWGVYIQLPRAVVLEEADRLSAELAEQAASSGWIQIEIGILITLLALGAITLLARQVVSPIRAVVSRLRDIASGEGDLTQRLQIDRQDELGELARWFNLFLDKLQGTVSQVVETVAGTRETASQAAAVAERTRDSLQAQFKEVEMVAAAFEEMNASAAEVAGSAGSAVASAKEAEGMARHGQQAVNESQRAMDELMQVIEAARPMAERLSDESDNIGNILEVIQAIAEQTNLLALNAAIEAARAGEQGRGFAVVADEVRSLAGRTQDSVVQIRELIEKLQGGTSGVVEAIVESHARAGRTRERVEASVTMLEQILEAVGSIEQMNDLISRAAGQQSEVIHSLNHNVATIRDVSQNISEEAISSARIGREMFTLADRQQALMGQFKV